MGGDAGRRPPSRHRGGRRFLELRPAATRPQMAGALLHDVGKVQSGLGTWGRVAATIVGPRTRRFRQYHDHEQIGADDGRPGRIRPGRPWPSSAVTDRPPPTSEPPTTASDRAPIWGRVTDWGIVSDLTRSPRMAGSQTGVSGSRPTAS